MDDFYDPDLEARLYAEVHYTNDSYSEGNIDPRVLAPEGDVPPGSIRSYAKKTGMIPKKHRALIDGPRTGGGHRMQEPAPRQEFRSNKSDVTRTIPSLFSLDSAIPPVPPRFTSPNPSRLNIPISSRLGPPISAGLTPLDFNQPNLFGNYPPDYPRSGHLLDPTTISFDNSRLPPYMYNQPPNFQLNSYVSDNFNQNLLDPYSSSKQDLPRFNQPDFIRLSHSSPNKSKAQSRRDSHMLNLKNVAKRVRYRRKREKRMNRKLLQGNKSNSSTPRKNPDRAARCPDLNKSGDRTKDVVNLDDSIEVIEIPESADDNLTQFNLESHFGNDEMNQGESVDDLEDPEESLDKSEERGDDNLDKSGHSLEKSDISDKSKNLDKSEEHLKTPSRNLEKSSKNLDKSNDNLKTPSKNLDKSDENLTPSKSLDKSNKNQDKSDQNLTPSRNLDKSNKSLDKSNKNQDKSDQNLTPSRNFDKSNKNQDKSNDNLKTPSKNLEKSDENLTLSKNLDKSNKNSEKPGHNVVKSKTLEPPNKSSEKSDGNSKTPSKNLGKSNPNLDKSDQNLAKSNENLDKSDSLQKSRTPTKNPKNKDPNLISKSSPEPLSKDKNSKYNIKSPSKFSKSMATLDSSSDSDSDESIFEVPVPPKPAPPLINLNDSDESDDSDSEEDSQDIPSKINLEEDENENDDDDDDDDDNDNNKEESSEKQIWDCDDDDDDEEDEEEEKNSNSEEQVWNCDDDDDDDDDVDDGEEKEEDRIEANFVLNCSQFQKAVPTLEELKKINLTNLEAKDDPKVSETITDTTKATTSTTTTIIAEDSGDKSRQPASKNLGSDKKRPRDESRNRDDSLKPIKVPRSDKSKDNTSFEEYVSKPMPVTLKAFYTDYRSSGCMNDVVDVQHKMSRNPNLWAILDADLVCRGGDKRLRCSFCHQPGHKRENCPDKKKPTLCHMCGEGGHSESRCPQRMCLTCGKKYSSYRKTCEYCRKLQCTLCKSVGHLKTNCPDLWRRYHQTTTSEGVNIPPDLREVLKPSHKLYCCNCTRRGHESSTCSRYRWSSHFPSPISVTSYTEGPSYPIIEPVEIPVEVPIPQEVPIPLEAPIPPQVPDPPPREEFLFHYQNCRVIPEDWCSDTIYPLEIPNISYDLDSKNQVPRFLTKHFPEGSHCYIYVHIKLVVPDKLVVELKTPSAPSTLELKKLMVQWMSRRKEDQNKMSRTQPLPVEKARLLNTLLDKFYEFITNSSFRGLTAYDHEIEDRINTLSSKMKSCRVNSIQASKFKNRLEAVEPRYSKKLLCSLYNFKLAPSAEAIINDFHRLLNLLSSDNAWEGDHGRDSLVPQPMYMNFCWFNFELFTIHLSDYIIHAKNLFLERFQQLKMRNVKNNLSAKEMGLQLMFTRPERVNFLSEGFKPGVLKTNTIKERHRQFAKMRRTRTNAMARKKQIKNKNNSSDNSKNNESANDNSSWNNDSSQNFGGSGNNKSFKNTSGSWNNESSKNASGSGNNDSSKNTGGSGNSGSSRNTGGSGNGESSKNIAGSRNSGSKNSDGSRKPKEKPTSLIVDGKINLEILQREKLACRAQAAVDLAKKHGLRDYADRAELMVRKIKSGGMVKKNAIEQLWSFLVKELRGNNISVQH